MFSAVATSHLFMSYDPFARLGKRKKADVDNL